MKPNTLALIERSVGVLHTATLCPRAGRLPGRARYTRNVFAV